jgi:aspartyl-tRNA(Asn)/glutamyl-tRNA(Gln) amidotransferase subunit C
MITKKDVEHIAGLARIGLSEAEKEKFEKELSAVLDFIGKLNEVDTSLVEPETGGTILKNITREDKEFPPLGVPEDLVNAAAKKEKGFIKVKGVFE